MAHPTGLYLRTHGSGQMTRKSKVTYFHYQPSFAYIENRYGWVEGSEGPEANVPALVNITSWQLLLEELVPDANERAQFSSNPGFPDINKYPFLASQQALEDAIQKAVSNIAPNVDFPIPETIRRAFHPKGT